jgi:ATP-dependent Clp protease ATP-binding subunit ClpA
MGGDRDDGELLPGNWLRAVRRTGEFMLLAQTAMHSAIDEAVLLQHDYVGTEHLLLGLLQTRTGTAAKVLGSLGVDHSRAQDAIVDLVGRGERTPDGVGLAARAKRAIDLAVEEARLLRDQDAATEHLLLGLLRVGEGTACRVLEALGAPPTAVRDRLLGAVFTRSRSESQGRRKDAVVTCRMTERDLDAIDALVEAGIRATRSDAVSWLVRAGIEANRSLFERVYATVADIRRLREEAKSIAHEEATGAPPAPEPPPEALTPRARRSTRSRR